MGSIASKEGASDSLNLAIIVSFFVPLVTVMPTFLAAALSSAYDIDSYSSVGSSTGASGSGAFMTGCDHGVNIKRLAACPFPLNGSKILDVVTIYALVVGIDRHKHIRPP